jgi:CubicO group peptidase (beta-lactamase class C family)
MIVGVILWACLGWFFQPWSAYSPFEMLMSLDPRGRTRVVTLRSFDEIFPHRVIHAPEAPQALERAEAPIDALYDWNGKRKLVETFIEQASVTGLLVMKNGVIVHERYRLGAAADSRFTTFSLAGGVVAALVGAARHDGLITSLDDALETYAPDFAGTKLGQTSLRNLLKMSAGTAFEQDFENIGPETYGYLAGSFLFGRDPDRLAAKTKQVQAPGEAFNFSGASTQALASAVSALYDAPLPQVVEDKIWRPLGMTADASWSQNREGAGGTALAFCCLNATLQDIARFGDLLRRDGVWGGQRILLDGWVAAASTPSPVAQPGAGLADGDAALGPWGYGLHVFIPENARGEFFLAGEYGQYLWIDQRQRTVVAITAADRRWRDRRQEATAALRAIVAAAPD